MSCQNNLSPINIEKSIDKICNLKCDYKFNYHNSHINIINKTDHLLLKYEPHAIPPVTFNDDKYQVEEMRIYQPSIHTYSGSQAEAELLIIHNSGSNKLIVSVPMSRPMISTNTTVLDNVLLSYNTTDIAEGELVQTNITNFNLNELIPKKSFYSYKAPTPFKPCNGDFNFVVFNNINGNYIPITNKSLDILKKSIVEHDIKANKNDKYYYNSKGAHSLLTNTDNDDVYIECNPTNQEGEVIQEMNEKDIAFSGINIKQNPEISNNINIFLHLFLGVIIMYVLLYFVNFLLTYDSSSTNLLNKFTNNLFTKTI